MAQWFQILAVAACACLGLAAVCPALAQDSAVDPKTCAEDAGIVTALLHSPSLEPEKGFLPVLSPNAPSSPPMPVSPKDNAPASSGINPLWLDNWHGEAAPQELIRAWLARKETSITQCWATDLAKAPLRILSTTEETRLGKKPLAAHQMVMLISLPVFDSKHTHAVVYVSDYCGGLCGAETLFALRKDGDRWLVTGDKLIGIS